MCDFGTAVGTTLQVGGMLLGQRATAKAAQAQLDAQAKSAITEMNYAFQNYEMERTDAFDTAVAEISKIRQNSMQLNSGVKAAVNESMSGRTANLLVRSVEGDTARAVASVKDNYQRKSNEIDLNKETTLKSTKSYIDSLNASAPKMPSALSNILGIGATVLGNTTAALGRKNAVLAQGYEWDWWTGGAKLGKSNTGKTYVGNIPLSAYNAGQKGRVQWL